MPLCQFRFGLAKLVFEDDGSLQHRDIKIPNNNYAWSTDTSIGIISSDGLFQSLLATGTSTIKVVD
jgi:hypothetical protein